MWESAGDQTQMHRRDKIKIVYQKSCLVSHVNNIMIRNPRALWPNSVFILDYVSEKRSGQELVFEQICGHYHHMLYCHVHVPKMASGIPKLWCGLVDFLLVCGSSSSLLEY